MHALAGSRTSRVYLPNLKAARKRQDVTYEYLVEQLDVPGFLVFRIEERKMPVPLETAEALADVLCVSLEELISMEES